MGRKITKIDIITRPSKLEDLKDALNKIGVHGMTVSQVYGTKKFIAGASMKLISCRKLSLKRSFAKFPLKKFWKSRRKFCARANLATEKFSCTNWKTR